MTSYKELYNQAVEAKKVKVVTPAYIEFKKKGDIVVGILRGQTTVESSRGQGSYNQYLVETDEGMCKFAMGQATDKEISQLLTTGRLYAFTFFGQEKLTGGRSVNKFQVEEVSGFVVSETDNPEDIPF